MGNLIGSNANDIVKAATINNALLSQKNTVSQKSILKTPKLRVDDNNVNPNAAAPVTITNLQGLSQYLGLYNSKGVVPVASLNKADNEVNTKINTSDTRINYVLQSNTNSRGADSSWTANTIVNGAFIASGSDVRVDILNSDSGYDNKIYWSTDNFQTKNYLGLDNQGGSYDLGSFAAGTQIKFAIDNGVGGFYQTGNPSANPDNYQHAKFTTTASGTEIGFEDLDGGGDQDFNDAIIQVKNVNQPPKNESQLNQATTQYHEVDSKQNQAPVETVNKSKLVFKSVLKGSDLKSLAHDKFIHPSEINKNLLGSAHNIDLHSDQTKINFINSFS
ncbi:DUF4114 domain-containing protein [Legionella sp. km772]|uniref:DUF4114 domain-containing protein n=1 Tax=Legionella sp. km772 TaxID=2498111 RepID=UPI000F8CCF4B|nr:DUF4114 domain-containing protein [Legionella sp. km772]RUR09323.1 DUF4114 domain-containing protein [Legionella sp. km772]